jgi:hypothetical protein
METTVLTKEQALVKEIHGEIDGEAERIVKEAIETMRYSLSPDYSLKIKSDRLKNIGFTSSKEVEEWKKHEERGVALQSAALYFKKKYPFNKFIDEYSFDKICRKYNLVCNIISRYTGEVPLKNLKEIEIFLSNFKWEDKINYPGTPPRCKIPTDVLYPGFDEFDLDRKIRILEQEKAAHEAFYVEQDVLYNRVVNLYIAAEKSMFKPDPPKNLDPIVFRYVRGGILIISKWGLEANDPKLVIPELN